MTGVFDPSSLDTLHVTHSKCQPHCTSLANQLKLWLSSKWNLIACNCKKITRKPTNCGAYANRQPIPLLSNIYQYKPLLYLPTLAVIFMSNYAPAPSQFDTPVWDVRVVPGGRKWYQSVATLSSPFLFHFCFHYRPIVHRLDTIQNVADDRRQRDNAIGIGHPCTSTGGLKIKVELIVFVS